MSNPKVIKNERGILEFSIGSSSDSKDAKNTKVELLPVDLCMKHPDECFNLNFSTKLRWILNDIITGRDLTDNENINRRYKGDIRVKDDVAISGKVWRVDKTKRMAEDGRLEKVDAVIAPGTLIHFDDNDASYGVRSNTYYYGNSAGNFELHQTTTLPNDAIF